MNAFSPVEVSLRPSRQLVILFTAWGVLLQVGVWSTQFPGWLKTGLALLALGHASLLVARHGLLLLSDSPVRVWAEHGSGLSLYSENRHGSIVRLHPGHLRVSSWLAVLHQRGLWSQPVYILRDNSCPEAFRRLRVLLNHH